MFALHSRGLQCTRGALGASLRPAVRTSFSTSVISQKPAKVAEPIVEEEELPPDPGARLPLSIQANYFEPLRRQSTHGLPVCNLQLRSFSIRNLEFMCDFALRAAYMANLPASGPVPLPKKIERWTVPRSNFVHKKSQENFERVTHKRLIQIQDGHPETVELWLAFLKQHQYHGVGMKANVWSWDEVGIGKTMNVQLETLRDVPRPKWAHFGPRKSVDTAEKAREILNSPEYKALEDDSTTLPAVEEVKTEAAESAKEPMTTNQPETSVDTESAKEVNNLPKPESSKGTEPVQKAESLVDGESTQTVISKQASENQEPIVEEDVEKPQAIVEKVEGVESVKK